MSPLLDQTLLYFLLKVVSPESKAVVAPTQPVVLVNMVAAVEALQSSPVPVGLVVLVLYQPIPVSKVMDSVLELVVMVEGSS
jgi:hypothetical protein